MLAQRRSLGNNETRIATRSARRPAAN